MWKELLLVGLGGGVGSILRFLVTRVSFNITTSLPFVTLIINVAGSFFIGLLLGLFVKDILSEDLRLLLAVGFCGGFTTFSAFSNENLLLIQSGQVLYAMIYIALSVLLGLLAVYIGFNIGK